MKHILNWIFRLVIYAVLSIYLSQKQTTIEMKTSRFLFVCCCHAVFSTWDEFNWLRFWTRFINALHSLTRYDCMLRQSDYDNYISCIFRIQKLKLVLNIHVWTLQTRAYLRKSRFIQINFSVSRTQSMCDGCFGLKITTHSKVECCSILSIDNDVEIGVGCVAVTATFLILHSMQINECDYIGWQYTGLDGIIMVAGENVFVCAPIDDKMPHFVHILIIPRNLIKCIYSILTTQFDSIFGGLKMCHMFHLIRFNKHSNGK